MHQLQPRVLLAVGETELGLGAQQLAFLAPQVGDDRRVHHFRQALTASAVRAKLVREGDAGLALGQVAAGRHQLTVDVGDLLVDHVGAAAGRQVEARAVGLDRGLVALHVGPQSLQPVTEPLRRLPRLRALRLSLVAQEQLDGPVRDLRCFRGTGRGEADRDHP